jgi:hypothetical protein
LCQSMATFTPRRGIRGLDLPWDYGNDLWQNTFGENGRVTRILAERKHQCGQRDNCRGAVRDSRTTRARLCGRVGTMRLTWLSTILLIFTLSADAQTMSHPKADCEALMNSVLPFAKQMLERHGEFLPFGGAMRTNGELVAVAGYDGSEHPPTPVLIRLIKDGFVEAARKKEYKATALVYDVRVKLPSSGEKSDAVAISLNHRDSYSVIVLFPYKLENSKLNMGTAYAQVGEADIFVLK